MPEQSLCLSWNIRAVQFGIRRRLALGRLAARGVLPRWPLWLLRLCWGGALVFAWLEQGWGQVLQWYAGQLADPDPLVRQVAADRLLLYGETWTVLAALAVLSSGPWLWRGLLGCLLGFGARRLPAGFGRTWQLQLRAENGVLELRARTSAGWAAEPLWRSAVARSRAVRMGSWVILLPVTLAGVQATTGAWAWVRFLLRAGTVIDRRALSAAQRERLDAWLAAHLRVDGGRDAPVLARRLCTRIRPAEWGEARRVLRRGLPALLFGPRRPHWRRVKGMLLAFAALAAAGLFWKPGMLVVLWLLAGAVLQDSLRGSWPALALGEHGREIRAVFWALLAPPETELTLKLTRRRVWALVRGRFGLPVPVACCRRAPLSLFCCEGDRLLLAGLPRAPLWRTSESCPYRCRRLIWLDLGDMEAQQRTALLAALRPVEVSALRGAAASDNAADRNGK